MDRNRLIKLLIISAALNFSACGGAAEKAGGDTKTATTSPAVNAATPAPKADGAANAGATPAAAATTLPASTGEPAARQGAPTASESSKAGVTPAAKMPTPQIGSGGNDFFLFTQARAAINNDSDLKAANVVVDVKGGVVTLSGAVANAALKSKAEQLARGAGSKEVRNQLRVSAGR
jgi:hypothetical protein